MFSPNNKSPSARAGGQAGSAGFKGAFKKAFVSRYRTKLQKRREAEEEEEVIASDTTSTKVEKKRQRKEARRQARLAREKLKQEDPFSYYFGQIDPDNEDQAKKAKRGRNRSALNSYTSATKKLASPNPSEGNLDQVSSEYLSSEEDDKTNPNFWGRDTRYKSLPANVRHAIDVSRDKAKHSEFYYRLRGLNERIHTYNRIFYNKMPKYQQVYIQKQIQKK